MDELTPKGAEALERWIAAGHHDHEALADLFEAEIGVRPTISNCSRCEILNPRRDADGV